MKTSNEIIASQPVSIWKIERNGHGAYDFPYEGTRIVLFQKSHHAFILTDKWCGDRAEGKCYRTFFEEIEYARAIDSIRLAAYGANRDLIADITDIFSDSSKRFDKKAPIWLRQAVKRIPERDAKEFSEDLFQKLALLAQKARLAKLQENQQQESRPCATADQKVQAANRYCVPSIIQRGKYIQKKKT